MTPPERLDLEPLYGRIEVTRTRGSIGPVISCAPTVALISPDVLFSERVHVQIIGRLITLADQVTYKITGWDNTHHGLIVLLEEDYR